MKTSINGKIQTIGLVEIISLVAISIAIITLFGSTILLILDLTSKNPDYWINKHLTYGIFATNMIFKIMMFQMFIFAASLSYKLFVNHNHSILTVGIDYINLIRGKELHSFKIIEPQFSKLAGFALWVNLTSLSSFL